MKEQVSATGSAAAGRGPGHPNSWLVELARIRRSPWDVGRSVRGALAMSLPWAVCIAMGSTKSAMWISLGALLATTAETGVAYRARFRPVIVGPLLGTLGLLACHLAGMPWSVTVAVMTVAGLIAGLASSYSALLSTGATQALLIASIAIGLPDFAAGWMPAVLFLSGVALYVILLGIEALFSRTGGRNKLIQQMIVALADLATRRAGAPSSNPSAPDGEVEAARRTVTASFTALGAAAMRTATHHFGNRDEGARLAAILAQGDAVFVAIMSSQDKAELQAAASALQGTATVLEAPPAGETATPSIAFHDTLGAALNGLMGALGLTGAAPSTASRAPAAPQRARLSRQIHVAFDKLVPTAATAQSAASVGLCLGIAYGLHWLIDAGHWFWIPLTVGLVMKPDLGSVFARAVLRAVGTVIGAGIGALIILALPMGVWLVPPIALLAGLIPLVAQRSYALAASVVTPAVLILISILNPGPVDFHYALVRIVDTVIGGGIALIFGYFIWPRTHFRQLSVDFQQAKGRIADYIRTIVPAEDGATTDRLPGARRAAYGSLMDMRTHLRTALAEPPPASDEAAAWFPLIASAERICDHVTAFATDADSPMSAVDAAALARIADYVSSTPEKRRQSPAPSCAGCSTPVVALFDVIGRQLQHMDRLRDDQAFQAISRPAPPPRA